jgi:hypothetical protein
LSSGASFCRSLFSISFLFFVAIAPALADVNSWIKPSSGNWEEPSSWSLGVLPNQSQSVCITNSGWKAVAIGANTAQNFPQSMTVQSLRVGADVDSFNLLMLNSSGLLTPLRVLTDLNIDVNGRVLLIQSGLNVSNALNLKGVLDQEGGQLVFTNSLSSIMQIEGGHFNLTNGLVTGANMYLGGSNEGFVHQDSGLVSLNWLGLGSKPTVPGSPGNGTYVLQSGWLIVGVHEAIGANGFGTLIQSGGTNSASTLFVSLGNYLKNGGGLFAGEVALVNASATMTHAGGTATITNMLRLNAQGSAARFNMLGGSLSTPRIDMLSGGLVTQSNGTVNVSSELFMEENSANASPVTYSLNGGNLFTARTTVSHATSSFSQNGGAHVVTNTLWINGSSTTYQFHGGTLNASNIVLTGNLNQAPQFFIVSASPYAITNQMISLFGGAIVIQDSAQRFGSLTLPADSGINLAGSSAILRFADSHTNNWESQLFGVVPKLMVFNWNGSTNGGGTDQLIFGNDSSSLTATQVAQILFVNPAGFPPGTNQARMLLTGEVVPENGGTGTNSNINAWIKPTSGAWEEQTAWSLGVLPNESQSVYITNAGWKAVAIGAGTAQNFSESMTVQNLRVGAPVDSYNLLLMNFSGFEQELETGTLTVESNGAVQMQSSLLHVLQGGLPYEADLFISGGNFMHGDFSEVHVDGRLRVASGNYFLTNGTVAANFYLAVTGKFLQYGGENNSTLHVDSPGEYYLYAGELNGFVRNGGNLLQYAGSVNGDMNVGWDLGSGHYVLTGGTVTGGMNVPAERGSGGVEQSGGTNFAASLNVGNGSRFGGQGSYVLSNGVVEVSSSTTLRALGTFEQWNGSHTIASNLVMRGADIFGPANASYSLRGGTLSAMNLTMWIANFVQQGGSNLITGDIVTGPPLASNTGQYNSLYTLNGGFLSASNVTLVGFLEGGNLFDDGGFDQTGGTNVISGALQITGQSTNFHGYTLGGGSLSVNNISISNGAAFHHSGGTINHSGALTLAGGNWLARPGEQALGPMRLIIGTSNWVNSTISFPAAASVLRLSSSSGQAWNPSAILYITNWHGSSTGGGQTQLYFGSNANGLTSQQIAQIKFALSGGVYPARILATGEVVPNVPQVEPLAFSRSGNTLILTWGSGWTLQSSMNVAGPYQDVPGATSPYAISMSSPSQFFRLRQ